MDNSRGKEWNIIIEYFYLIAHYRQYKSVLHGFTGQLHTAFTGRYVCRHVFTIMSDTHMRWPMLLSTDGNRIPTFWYIDTKPIPTWYLVFQSQCVSYFVDIITPRYINLRPAGAPGFPRPAGGGCLNTPPPSNSAPGPRSDTG